MVSNHFFPLLLRENLPAPGAHHKRAQAVRTEKPQTFSPSKLCGARLSAAGVVLRTGGNVLEISREMPHILAIMSSHLY